jgi:hypothetical protein
LICERSSNEIFIPALPTGTKIAEAFKEGFITETVADVPIKIKKAAENNSNLFIRNCYWFVK